VLPASFGFGNQQQRVCDTCLELVQQGDAGPPEHGGGGGNAATDMEVRREGSLLKKGGIGQQFKARHFVCTRAGFLHYFDSKFDLTPKGSIPLHQVPAACCPSPRPAALPCLQRCRPARGSSPAPATRRVILRSHLSSRRVGRSGWACGRVSDEQLGLRA
jgi:hypothetical protein